jgi:hypothetical protein
MKHVSQLTRNLEALIISDDPKSGAERSLSFVVTESL